MLPDLEESVPVDEAFWVSIWSEANSQLSFTEKCLSLDLTGVSVPSHELHCITTSDGVFKIKGDDANENAWIYCSIRT
jgi:hypothetical protein